MIKNACGVLKNGDKIFKSQVVDSYLRTNTTGIIYLSTYVTGLTTSAPLYTYNQTPSGTIKCTYTNDPTFMMCFPATGEGSQKFQYFCGNLEGVRYMCPYTSNNVGRFGGDLPKFASQFPNLDYLDMAYQEVGFNQNISYSSFLESLRVFYLIDRRIQGDVATVCGIENVECWKLNYTALCGNFHGIKTTALKSLCASYTPSTLKFDFNCLSANNPNYTYSYLNNVQGAQMCADTMNIENFIYVNRYTPVNMVKGNFSNWCFNTDLTYYCTAFKCVQGDLTNWNIPETKVTTFNIYNQGHSVGVDIGGSLSGWTMPSTLEYFSLSQTRKVTSIPNDYSGSPNLCEITMNHLPALSGDITTFIFPNNMNQLMFTDTQMCGNLENFVFPTGVTSPQLVCNNFTGNLSGITLPSNALNIYLHYNCLSGNVADFVMPPGVHNVNLSNENKNKGTIYLDLNKTFDTKNICNLTLNNMTGVTGSFSNMTVGNALLNLYMCNSNISADLNKLDLNKIQLLALHSSNICQDITPMFTGTTNVCLLCICQNPHLSADTTNWQVDKIQCFVANNTALSGRLCHSKPYWMNIQYTDICSCIDTDFNLSGNSYYITMNNAKLQGNLSNVNLNYNNIQQFYINNNSNVCGANEFANKIFINRKNFYRPNTSLYWHSIGDNVTGETEILGDLGTWDGDTWDLTEAQVNHLAAGTNYDGEGTNIPWDSKQKIYWMKNALNQGSVTKRYVCFYICYN